MNWDMIGAVGEILGAAGVIVTLGYLARQIRFSSRQDQRLSGQATLDKILDFLAAVGADEDLTAIWARGAAGIEALSPVERVRLGIMYVHLTYLWERIQYLAEEGAIDPMLIGSMLRGRAEIVCAPGYRAWFEHRKHWYSAGIRAAIEADMESCSGGYRPMGLGPKIS